MPTATINFGTYADFATRDGFDKTTRKIIELQAKTNEIMEDMIVSEANEGSVCKTTVRQQLPQVAWRMINKGTKPGKSATGQISFTSGGMENFAFVDERMLQSYGGVGSERANEWRLGENEAYQEAQNIEMATTLFYGDEKVNPAKFTGLGAYYYSPDIAKCSAAEYVIDAGGTGASLTSIWLVNWGQTSIHGFFPAGTSAGFKYRDNGRVQAFDDDGGKLYGYESQYNWDLGLAVRDYRQAVRICNINLANITDTALINALIAAHEQLYSLNGKVALYCNRKVTTKIMQLAQAKTNVNLGIDEFGGKKLTHFWGIPFRRCDAIVNTEGQLT